MSPGAAGFARALLRLARPHQWTKNFLLLLPPLAHHLTWTPALATAMVRALLAFSLLGSFGYVLNDLHDAPEDRLHPTKCKRPIASRAIGSRAAAVFAAALLLGAAALALTLPVRFQLILTVYGVGATAYTLALKRRLLLDVIVLAMLYTLRVFAGGAAVNVPLSSWFVPFTIFFFLSLALAKRVTELRRVGGNAARLPGRAYGGADIFGLAAFGIASSTAAALVYCLYLGNPAVTTLYTLPELLWAGLPLLLYWEARLWLFALRGELDHDPVVFALRDRVSFLALGTFLGIVWLAA